MNVDNRYIRLMDQNFLLSMGMLMSNTVTGEFFDTYNYGIYHSGIPTREFNVVFVKRRTSKPSKLCLAWERFFSDRGLPFRLIITPLLDDGFASVLAERGYQKMSPLPAMLLLELPQGVEEKPGFTVRHIKDRTGLAHFQEAAVEGFSLPEGSGPFILTEQILNLPDCDMFVGYYHGQPACTSMLVRTGPVAGIYWVSTLAEYRNRGFGEAVTRYAIYYGRLRGCEFASLQASNMGRPIYEKIGFDNSYQYLVYALPE